MEEDVHEYTGAAIDVSYDANRCIHVRACVEGLPAVFDPSRRPWVRPDAGDPDAVAAVVEQCPTGALHYERTDGGPTEAVPPTNTVTSVANGPLYLRGAVDIRATDGELRLDDTRVALCRCGRSRNKPLCDNSHERVFEADGVPRAEAIVVETPDDGDSSGEARAEPADGQLTVTPIPDGPLRLEGPFRLRRGDGSATRLEVAELCRCGGSANKPFCDDTHVEIGFSTEGED